MSSQETLVTIGICVYNGEPFLRQTLNSALSQTHQNLEIILFNDGSTDRTHSVLDEFSDPRIHRVDSNRNRGVGYARQVVKTLARGEYFAWLDADDIYHPNRIETLLRHALDHGSDLTCDVYRLMTHQGEITAQTYRIPEKVSSDPHFTRLFERNVMIPHPLTSARCLKSVEYDTDLKVSDDYDFWLKASYAGYLFSFVDEIKLDYRLTEGSLTSDPKRSRAETREILGKYPVPELATLYQKRGFSREHINYMQCLQYLFRQDYESALSFAFQPWPDEEDVDQDFYQGTLLLRDSQLPDARMHLESHLSRHPESPAGKNNMGVLLRLTGETGGSCFSDALSILPDYQDAADNLASGSRGIITDTQIRV